MSPASARAVAVTRSPGLLADYLAHVDGLDLSGRARRDRRVAATRFLATFGDLEGALPPVLGHGVGLSR